MSRPSVALELKTDGAAVDVTFMPSVPDDESVEAASGEVRFRPNPAERRVDAASGDVTSRPSVDDERTEAAAVRSRPSALDDDRSVEVWVFIFIVLCKMDGKPSTG